MGKQLTKRHTRNLERAMRHVRTSSSLPTYSPAGRKALADQHRSHKSLLGSKKYRTMLRLKYRKMMAGSGQPRVNKRRDAR